MPGSVDRETVAARLEEQARWCLDLGSSLYGGLLERAAADCRSGGICWSILGTADDASAASALPLRFLGAVHRLALSGAAPALAAAYPSAGGVRQDDASTWEAFVAVLTAQADAVREGLRRPVQTNEVGRSAVLAGGFLTLAAAGKPLRLLELGCSAGLNLRWDHYRYVAPGFVWGAPDAAVCFESVFEGPGRPPCVPVRVVERSGCDPELIDPTSPEGELTLRSYLWPDQQVRRARLDAALTTARVVAAETERAGAVEWLERRLAQRREGVTTVVYHSVVMQYVGREGVARIASLLRGAGEAASEAAPLAWLSFEPRRGEGGEWRYVLALTRWPGGAEQVLAEASPHGPPVRWLGEDGVRRFSRSPS